MICHPTMHQELERTARGGLFVHVFAAPSSHGTDAPASCSSKRRSAGGSLMRSSTARHEISTRSGSGRARPTREATTIAAGPLLNRKSSSCLHGPSLRDSGGKCLRKSTPPCRESPWGLHLLSWHLRPDARYLSFFVQARGTLAARHLPHCADTGDPSRDRPSGVVAPLVLVVGRRSCLAYAATRPTVPLAVNGANPDEPGPARSALSMILEMPAAPRHAGLAEHRPLKLFLSCVRSTGSPRSLRLLPASSVCSCVAPRMCPSHSYRAAAAP